DGHTMAGSFQVSSATASFVASDLGQLISGQAFPSNTRIVEVVDGQNIWISNPAAATLDDADLTILGRTILAASGTTFFPGDIGKEIQGIQVPGGSIITNAGNYSGGPAGHVLSTALIDLSQPANNPSAGESVRIWDESPTPASLLTTGPNAGKYL